jgi:MFS family permease
VYTLTGSASLTAVTYGVNILVSVVLQPLCGALVTNMNKKALIVGGDICRGALVCVIAALYLTGLVRPWMLILSTGLMSTFEAFSSPAGSAVFPLIVSKEKYTQAMSLNSAARRTAELVGTGIAGTIIAFLGIGGALAVDAATFFISAAILMTLRIPEESKASIKEAFGELAGNFKSGLRYLFEDKLMLAICVSTCVINLTLVPFSSLQAPYVSESLKLGAQALSLMGMAMSGGMLLGSAIYPSLASAFSRFRLLFIGVLGTSASYMALAVVPLVNLDWLKMVLLAVVMVLMGIPLSFANNSIQVGIMTRIDKNYISRVIGIMGSAGMAAMPLGSFVIATAAKFVSVTGLILWSGIASVLISLSFLLVKPLRDL